CIGAAPAGHANPLKANDRAQRALRAYLASEITVPNCFPLRLDRYHIFSCVPARLSAPQQAPLTSPVCAVEKIGAVRSRYRAGGRLSSRKETHRDKASPAEPFPGLP